MLTGRQTGKNEDNRTHPHIFLYLGVFSKEVFIVSPGMPEMLSPSAALVGAGLGASVALVTDGRFSGASRGHI